MAHWRLGDRELARHVFDKGVQAVGCQKYPLIAVKSARAEAAALLGIAEPPMPDINGLGATDPKPAPAAKP
jgi:hypothetical protein